MIEYSRLVPNKNGTIFYLKNEELGAHAIPLHSIKSLTKLRASYSFIATWCENFMQANVYMKERINYRI